jgi:MOSC domain-containing protein YiiM
LRVISSGAIQAGDDVAVVSRPDHGVLIRHLITGPRPDSLEKLLAGEDLPPKVVRDARRWQRKKSK